MHKVTAPDTKKASLKSRYTVANLVCVNVPFAHKIKMVITAHVAVVIEYFISFFFISFTSTKNVCDGAKAHGTLHLLSIALMAKVAALFVQYFFLLEKPFVLQKAFLV